MSPTARPTVEGAEPPNKLAKVVNPIVKTLLLSPLHRLVSQHLMLLTFTGRKSDRTYDVVLGRHRVGGNLMVPTGRQWRLNFRGGIPVIVTLEGRPRRGRGVLVEDPDEVARIHELLLERIGLKNVRRLGLKVNVDRKPTNEELKTVLAGRGVISIELEEVEGNLRR